MSERRRSMIFFLAKKRKPALAAAAFFLAALWYKYPRVAGYGPVSRHYWRQSDGASFARCYYEEGMRFFQPRLHHVVGGEHAAVGEFPILYYAVAGLYGLFGPRDAWFRVFNFSLFLLGLAALYSLLLEAYERDIVLALLPPGLLLASPLLAFYSFNFLPNAPAFGLMLCGAWVYWRGRRANKAWLGAAALALVVLAGLIKISALLPFVAFVGAGLLCRLFFPKLESARRLFPSWGALLAAAAVTLAIVSAWYAWAAQYNEKHNAAYFFLISIKPIWAMDKLAIEGATRYMLEHHLPLLYHGSALYILLVANFVLLLFPRLLPAPWYCMLALAFLGSVAYLLLFYDQLMVHEYYFIELAPWATLVFALALWTAKRRLPHLGAGLPWKLALGVLLLLNLRHAAGRLRILYQPDSDYINPAFTSLNKREALHEFLQRHDIAYPQLAVTLPDVAPNATLYYLNLKGWNPHWHTPIDSATIDLYRRLGARYLVITDSTWLEQPDYQWALRQPIGVFDGRIYFFSLR
jgi:hypothetical protein